MGRSANLIVIEADQVDVLNVYDVDNVADKSGGVTANACPGSGWVATVCSRATASSAGSRTTSSKS